MSWEKCWLTLFRCRMTPVFGKKKSRMIMHTVMNFHIFKRAGGRQPVSYFAWITFVVLLTIVLRNRFYLLSSFWSWLSLIPSYKNLPFVLPCIPIIALFNLCCFFFLLLFTLLWFIFQILSQWAPLMSTAAYRFSSFCCFTLPLIQPNSIVLAFLSGFW